MSKQPSSRKLTSNLNAEETKALLLKQLEKQRRFAVTDRALGKITTWAQFTTSTGFAVPAEYQQWEVTAELINKIFAQKVAELDAPAVVVPEVKPEPVSAPAKVEVQAPEETYETTDDDYSEIPSLRSNPLVNYEPFQERAAAIIVRNFLKHNHYACALNSRAGSGKTFILSGVIRELYRRNWHVITESLSMYPVVFVTRASIVEQTERVLRDQFGLKLGTEVDVTNIDQFRCKFGEQFVKEKILRNGDSESVVFEWNPLNAPGLLIIDESHGVKNIESTQSRIFQAFNELDGERHRQIHSSATLFTRVVEAKCFAVATRLQW